MSRQIQILEQFQIVATIGNDGSFRVWEVQSDGLIVEKPVAGTAA